MITDERRQSTESGGPPRPPGGLPPWWRLWPSPGGRPQPVNRRSVILGVLVTVPALVFIDGLLSAMAGYASHNVMLALVLFAVLFCFTGLEFALVAYITKRRQDVEARRAAED